MRLIERPYAMRVLQDLFRELHYWLLAGRHGPAIRELVSRIVKLRKSLVPLPF